jgi:hypothetical protein
MHEGGCWFSWEDKGWGGGGEGKNMPCSVGGGWGWTVLKGRGRRGCCDFLWSVVSCVALWDFLWAEHVRGAVASIMMGVG